MTRPNFNKSSGIRRDFRGGGLRDLHRACWNPDHQFRGPSGEPGALEVLGQAVLQVRTVRLEEKVVCADADMQRSQQDTLQLLGM